MAPSWNELSSDHKIVFLVEGLLRNKNPDTPMACRVCNQAFVDNKGLIDHFQSHFHQNGTSNPRPQVQTLASPENGAKLFSSSAQSSHSVANGGVGPHARGSIPRNMSNRLVMGNSLQLKRTTLTHNPPSYPYPSRSIIRQRNVSSPIGLTTSGTITSHPTNFCFSSNAGTSGIARGTTASPLVATVREYQTEDVAIVYTKPFILHLEQPTEKMIVGDNNPDGLDLTLKL